MRAAEQRWDHRLQDYRSLYDFSLARPTVLAVGLGVRRRSRDDGRACDRERGPDARGALLSRRAAQLRGEPAPAPGRRTGHRVQRREPGASDAHRLAAAPRVGRFAQALRRQGIQPGDRVAGFLPNLPEASWRRSARPRSARSGRRARRTSACRACSTGSARSSPAILVAADGYFYGGKTIDLPREDRRGAASSCRRSSGR